jgi:hypothetical protein
MRFQNRADSHTQSDADLIAAAIYNRSGTPLYSPKHNASHYNTDQQEITELLKDKEALLEVIGTPPGTKGEGITRILYENVNGLPARLCRNPKLDKCKTIINDLAADMYCFNEHKNNYKHKENRRHGVAQLFDGGETLVKGIVASNQHETVDRFLSRRLQEGGTGMVAFGETASLMNHQNSGHDATGLARWTYMELKGTDEHSTMVLIGYVPCKNNRSTTSTTYQQQRRYFLLANQSNVCPRQRFLEDLLSLLQSWKTSGKRIVVMLDANEDIYRGMIGRTLTKSNGLDLVETVGHASHAKLTATHFRGSRPIDAVWTSRDLEISNAALCQLDTASVITDSSS